MIGGNTRPIMIGCNTGPIMIGPYGNHHRTVRPHQPFPYHHDAMHMVGHHHKFTHVHMRHVLRYRIPTLAGQFTDGRWVQNTVRDMTEPMQPVLGADGQVIRAALGVIVSRPSVGRAVRQIGHGDPNFGLAPDRTSTPVPCTAPVMRLLRLLLPLLLLAPNPPATAQWHANDPVLLFQRFEGRMHQSPADSAAFARFSAALARTKLDIGPLPDPREYRLVWEVNCEGGTWLGRGNGTYLATFLKDPPEKRFTVPVCCPSFFGGRYAVVHWEPPTGLVRYRYWFFERVER